MSRMLASPSPLMSPAVFSRWFASPPRCDDAMMRLVDCPNEWVARVTYEIYELDRCRAERLRSNGLVVDVGGQECSRSAGPVSGSVQGLVT